MTSNQKRYLCVLCLVVILLLPAYASASLIPASCSGKTCGEDQRCIIRRGVPRCVCSPQCQLKHKAVVCGIDGRTYTSECHLLKRACRKKQSLQVAHSGPCETCSGVKCGKGKQCVLDERLVPTCKKCPTSCPKSEKSRPMCGSDGMTYDTSCHVKLASCNRGETIIKAYKGPCSDTATCETVNCRDGLTCLTDVLDNTPRCTKCNFDKDCKPAIRHLCGSDGRVYHSWCSLQHEACRSGRALTTLSQYRCNNNRTVLQQVCQHHTKMKHRIHHHHQSGINNKKKTTNLIENLQNQQHQLDKHSQHHLMEHQSQHHLIDHQSKQHHHNKHKKKKKRKKKKYNKKTQKLNKQTVVDFEDKSVDIDGDNNNNNNNNNNNKDAFIHENNKWSTQENKNYQNKGKRRKKKRRKACRLHRQRERNKLPLGNLRSEPMDGLGYMAIN